MSAADLRESVARAVRTHTWNEDHPDGPSGLGELLVRRVLKEYGEQLASAALRAIADAGPSEKMVEAAARLIARDFALSTSIGGAEAWSAERWPDFSDIARSALSAALKEMGE